ncbi:MAG: pitrilysin family protein [Cyanobacteria bacterium P01_H01_bin.121]
MRRWLGRFGILLGCTVLCIVVSYQYAQATQPRHYTELTFPELPPIQLPDYERIELSNGLVIYLAEDRELPLVGGSALLRTGSRWEPGDQTGLAALTGQLLRSGGTTARSVDAINEFLEQRAASIETGIGTTSGSASFSTLSEDLDPVLELFAEILRQPAFAQDRLELAKQQYRASIARRNDNPNQVTSREFRKVLYGDKSPYARTIEYDTLANIERADLVDYYNQYVRPDQMIIGIVGDFDKADLRQKLETLFGDWQVGDRPLPDLPGVSQANEGVIFAVDQPQLTQSFVQLGHLGGTLDNPDLPALAVLNEVLNGPGGRLYDEVRSRQGLAYSVYGVWSAQYDYPGFFVAGGATQTETTAAFIQGIRREIERLREVPITAEELQQAKDSVLSSFVFNFQRPGQTISRLMTYEYYNYPADFIFQYQRGIEAVTSADLQRVAQQYLDPEQLVTLIVGNTDVIQPELKQELPDLPVKLIELADD